MTSPVRPEPTTESYFVGLLAENAKRKDIAAPATIRTLTKKLSYLSEEQIEQVRLAHAYAADAHKDQWRRTGHKYITHPTAVAMILAEMRMDHQTVMAALLHDVIEDSDTSKATLGEQFGEAVAEIVDGVSKLSRIFSSRAEAQAENFQKMALAMAKDIRVIMVKMADRLHNMRTIGVMSPEQRKRIARETLDFYAPIANRLGIHTMKTELEELGFKALYPLRADRINRAVKSARGHRVELMEEIVNTMTAALNRDGISAKVYSREKHSYSIYRKMKTQHKSFNEIMDVFGFRIVVDQVDACYRTLVWCTTCSSRWRGALKTTLPSPKPMATNLCTHPCSACTVCPLKSRSVPSKWMPWRKTVLPDTGCTKPETGISSPVNAAHGSGYRICWSCSARPATRWNSSRA